uniref:HAD family hydrolase n=1 Tax=candidate division CPR3 bacterium TaxID=2268181 RepID=A0A7V3J9S2_UNCC3
MIGLDFDGVINDFEQYLEKGGTVEEALSGEAFPEELKPMCEEVLDLLRSGLVSVIITNRDDLRPVREWISYWVPEAKDVEIESSAETGKGKICKDYNVLVFVDDDRKHIDDVEKFGVIGVYFDRKKYETPVAALLDYLFGRTF